MDSSVELSVAQHAKRGQYEIRTRHRSTGGKPLFVNYLILESSPYLLQHAHNPVAWRGWNEASFGLAQERNKPVFLSVGYSTCHWCHVMEEESFDDQDVAELLNQHFVAIKVDREQRPDLDEIYMTALQIIRGNGGWPMSLFLTPDGAPFFGGTYYSKEQFLQVLQQVKDLWNEEQDQLQQQANQLLASVKRYLEPGPQNQDFNRTLIPAVTKRLLTMSDQQYGGFGRVPKFPQEPYLVFLLDQIARTTDTPLYQNDGWTALKKALDGMLKGGLYDQVAGGFHRYAVDQAWQVPHFEKMLYNQAQLAQVYCRGYELCGDQEYQRIISETLAYVVREMRTEDGLFYSATDADSEGEEGRFFVWTVAELKALLSVEQYELCCQCYEISDAGNFDGRIVLNLKADLTVLAQQSDIDYAMLVNRLQGVRQCLYRARCLRVPPLTDHKVIAEWNGMMIIAFATAARIFGDAFYYDIAATAANRLLQLHRREDGRLWRLSLNGVGKETALLEDYAQVLAGLIALYDVQQDQVWLEQALALYRIVYENHWDNGQGGFFVSSQEVAGPLLVKSKNVADTATVSGNAMMLLVMTQLVQRREEDPASDQKRRIQQLIPQHIRAFATLLNQNPLSSPVFLKGMMDCYDGVLSSVQYAAGGHIRLRLIQSGAGAAGSQRVILQVTMDSGWHIDCDTFSLRLLQPEQAFELERGHPKGVLEGQSEFELELPAALAAAVELLVGFQACGHDSCRPKETVRLTLWIH